MKFEEKFAQWEPSCSVRTDRQTHMTKLIVAFLNVVNPPKNVVRGELLLISINALMSCVAVKRRQE